MPKGEGIHRDIGRHTPALGAHIFLGQPNIFFVTVNAKDAVPWMANATVQNSLADIWSTEATAWLVGYYLVMPDHIHLFCTPRDLHFGIDQWVEFWKSRFSRRHVEQPWCWQRNSFHHRIRTRIEYEDKLTYVRENPLRKQLVAQPTSGFIKAASTTCAGRDDGGKPTFGHVVPILCFGCGRDDLRAKPR